MWTLNANYTYTPYVFTQSNHNIYIDNSVIMSAKLTITMLSLVDITAKIGTKCI